MIKKISLSLFASILFASPVLAADLFDESYQEEQARIEVEKNIKKNEIISPEEIARMQNKENMKRDLKIKNMDPQEAKDFVRIGGYILEQADEGYKSKKNQDVKTFYKENLDYSISDLIKSSPDEY